MDNNVAINNMSMVKNIDAGKESQKKNQEEILGDNLCQLIEHQSVLL
jgi:hypothetical protein